MLQGMLRGMDLKDALKQYLAGHEVLVMYDETSKEGDVEYQVEPLGKALGRAVRYLVDVPKDDDLEIGISAYKGRASDNPDEDKQPVSAEAGESFKKIDEALLLKLDAEGKSQHAVAAEMGVSQSTVGRRLRILKNQKQAKKQPVRKCPTCIYRSGNPKKNNCDYSIIMKHSRPCKADDCTVYQEGDRMKHNTNLTLNTIEERKWQMRTE